MPDAESELEDALMDVLSQACSRDYGAIDSCALTAYAAALRLLARRGRFKIEKEVGRRIIGTWIEPAEKTP